MKVWAMRTGPISDREADLLMMGLPTALQEKLRAKGEVSRLRSLWAYSLLRFAVQTAWGTALPEIAWSPAGKPYFSKRDDLFFNVSHADGAVMVGLAHREIGVDLEKDRQAPVRLQRLLQTEEPFFAAWVQWEAAAKCLGQPVLSVLRKGVLPREMVYDMVETFPGYWACGATSEENAGAEVTLLTREQLLVWCAGNG